MSEWEGPAPALRAGPGGIFGCYYVGVCRNNSVLPLIFFCVLRSFFESLNHSCEELHGFSALMFLTFLADDSSVNCAGGNNTY